MRKGSTHILAAVVLVAVAGMAAFAVGCSSSDNATPAATSAADIAHRVLGHAPAGLAKTIEDRGYMIVANDADYPPQSSIDKSTGKLVGFDVDVAKKTGELLGLRVKFVNPAWVTIPAGLIQNKWDVSIGSMPITPERQKALDFTDPYYYTSGQVFVKKGGPQISGPADLAGKKVGVAAASTYYDYLKKHTKAIVETYQTSTGAFQDLANGNLDFLMTAGPTGQQAILSGQPFEFSGKPLFYEDLAFAIKKGEADWLALLNYAVRTMHKDGSLTAMSKRWYHNLDLTVK
jgi:polar amino acid transport system substrate-binding protein